MSDQRFQIVPTPVSGLAVVERRRIEDRRGFLSRIFCAEELAEAGLVDPIIQINHSLTRVRGAVRGMHFQRPPHAEAKLVSCLRGEVFDVAIDLRAGSDSFLKWHGERLSAENGRALLIPQGFAHGFQTMSEDCELLYLHTAQYAPEAEGGIGPLDPAIGIDWPLPISELSDRDRDHPWMEAAFAGFTL